MNYDEIIIMLCNVVTESDRRVGSGSLAIMGSAEY